jgi:hypothetical protein
VLRMCPGVGSSAGRGTDVVGAEAHSSSAATRASAREEIGRAPAFGGRVVVDAEFLDYLNDLATWRRQP